MEKNYFENVQTIETLPDFKIRVNDAINNFQALRLDLISLSFEEIMDHLKEEVMFVHLEDYLQKKGYALSPFIKDSQQAIINRYDAFIDAILDAKNIEEIQKINTEAISYLKEASA